jgi:hypothetical protein
MLGAEIARTPLDVAQPIAGEQMLCTVGFSGNAE